jgi:hypothetical protein
MLLVTGAGYSRDTHIPNSSDSWIRESFPRSKLDLFPKNFPILVPALLLE